MQESTEINEILLSLKSAVNDDLALSGKEFFDAIVSRLRNIFNADYVFVGLLNLGVDYKVRTISLNAHGKIIENIEYGLHATPCANVAGQSACCYSKDICTLFSEDLLLQQMNIEGYVGVPLFKSDNTPLGVIVALFENEIEDTSMVETIIQLFATKTANELERMAISKELNESTTHFYEIFNSAPIALVELNLKKVKETLQDFQLSITKEMAQELLALCVVENFNEKAQQLLNINTSGKSLDEILQKSDYQIAIDMFTSLKNNLYSGKKAPITYMQNEQEYTLSLHWTVPSEYHQSWEHLLISIEDITEFRQIEHQLHNAQKMDAIGKLAGGIAHDFNNMLGGILGSAELLHNHLTNISDKDARLLDIIISSAKHSAELTSKLLSFSRDKSIHFTPLDLADLIEETISLLKRTIDKKILITFINESKNSQIMGSDSSLQNVLVNLGINASHAMPGGGNIAIKTRNVVLDQTYCSLSPFELTPGTFIEIEVSDTGTGIPSSVIQHIFEPFFTTKEVGKGTGLGLASAYGEISNHNGAITVYSEEGTGTVFHIYLPCSAIDKPIEIENEVIEPGTGTILLVDDEEVICETSKAMLESLGYTVMVATNGEEALKFLKQGKSATIKAVLTDMIMPKMNGKELFYALKESSPELPVILASGFTNDEKISPLLQDGLFGFLPKPFHITELSKMLSQLNKK